MSDVSLIDYPEHVAAMVFTQGCNLRCPYCHNGPLVEPVVQMDADEIFEKIIANNLVDSVVITGGEPTIQEDLNYLIAKINMQTDLKVKLDTNGTRPDVLSKVAKYCDFIAMDIKTDYNGYKERLNTDPQAILESVDIVMKEAKDYEFRCTAVYPWINMPCLNNIGLMVRGAKNFVFQQAVMTDTLIPDCKITSFGKFALEKFAKKMRYFVPNVEVRTHG